MFGREFWIAFWIAAGLFILLGILARFGAFRTIGIALDQRALRIQNELAEASKLRLEAEVLIKEYTLKRDNAEKEAAEIIEDAKKAAEELVKIAEAKLAGLLAQKTQAAEAKIAQNEKYAIDAVRNAAADAALIVAEQILKQEFASSAIANQYLDGEITKLKKVM